MYRGVRVSKGVAIGKAMVLDNKETDNKCYVVSDIQAEKHRIKLAFHKAKSEIEEMINTLTNETEKEIINTHLLMVQDPELIAQIHNYIDQKSVNAEWAVEEVIDKFIKEFNELENNYIKQRAVDIKDIKLRLIKSLKKRSQIDSMEIEEDCIILADDLLPSYMVQIDQTKVVGFISNKGGINSHTSIIARSLQKPMIIGIENINELIKNQDLIAIDADLGTIFINPNQETINKIEQKIQNQILTKQILNSLPDKTITKDSHPLALYANIGSLEDAITASENKAEGIGLFRTEFIYLNRNTYPTEQEQYEIYLSVLSLMQGKEVIIRTVDIGADKQLEYLNLPHEENPFLGLRGIRLCLARKEMFRTHLRALLRASVYGEMKIMYPMIANVDELKQANEMLNECKIELDNEKIAYNKNLKVGIMIEVPSAVINSDILAKYADFFSIGTNDLIQYTIAVDRMNDNLSSLYSIYDKSIIKSIKMVVDNAIKNKIPVSLCGEASSEELMLPVYLALKIDCLSMNSQEILLLRKKISQQKIKNLKNMINEIMELESANEIKSHLHNYLI